MKSIKINQITKKVLTLGSFLIKRDLTRTAHSTEKRRFRSKLDGKVDYLIRVDHRRYEEGEDPRTGCFVMK